MSLAMSLAIVGEGLIWGSTIYGAGRHMGDIPPEHISTGLKLNFISQPVFLIAICVVKLAVGSTLLRIASSTVYRRIIIGIMVFMGFYTIGCFFVGACLTNCVDAVLTRGFCRLLCCSAPTLPRSGTPWWPRLPRAGTRRRSRRCRTPT